MSGLAKSWLVGVAVALVAGGASGAQAQVKVEMSQAEISRSQTVVAQLAWIEANKETFVDELLTNWAKVLNPEKYNVFDELKPIAMAATPWQLYGASQAENFTTFTKLLRGTIGAGKYVNAVIEATPVAVPNETVLGSRTDQLVFVPIAPCRVVDTRGTGTRTGILAAGASRSFDLEDDFTTAGQGGQTATCTGIPVDSPYGWAVNITVTGYAGTGVLKAWPYLGTEPSTSIINYFAAAPALANATTLTGCDLCGDDITVKAVNASTHVIIDVMGYYQQATGFISSPPTITKLAGTTTAVAAGGFQSIAGAACPAGTTAIGGASTNGSVTGAIATSDHNLSGSYWYEYAKNNGGSSVNVTVYTICMDNN